MGGDALVNPEEPGDYEWICYGSFDGKSTIHGKWMVFKHFDQLNNALRNIIHAIEEGKLEGYEYLKASTKVYRPGSYGPGPCTTGVIEVYTTIEKKDKVGKQLCLIVMHDIQFKTEKATKDGIYAGNKYRKPVTTSNMVYNKGSPCMKDRWTDLGYRRDRADIWHLNIVKSRHHSEEEIQHYYGKWIIPITKKEATGVWHILRREIESKNHGVLLMECPPSPDKNKFFLHIFTDEKEWQHVGKRLLLTLLERELTFEFSEERHPFILEW